MLGDSLVIRYEDLRGDTPRELRRLASFLTLEPSDAIVDAVVEYAAFENMKQREAEKSSDSDRLRPTDVSNPDSFKTRRGKVGGWSDYFDDTQCAEIDRIVETTLHPSYGYRIDTAAAASAPNRLPTATVRIEFLLASRERSTRAGCASGNARLCSTMSPLNKPQGGHCSPPFRMTDRRAGVPVPRFDRAATRRPGAACASSSPSDRPPRWRGACSPQTRG